MEAPHYDIVMSHDWLEVTDLFSSAGNFEQQGIRRDIVEFLTGARKNGHFVLDFPSEKDLEARILENPVWEHLINYGPIDHSLHPAGFEWDDLLTKGRPLKLFFLNKPGRERHLKIEGHGYALVPANNAEKAWAKSPFSGKRHDRTLVISREAGGVPAPWAAMASFACPIHSLVIHDPYLFSDSFERNAKPLIEALLRGKAATKVPFHLLIITNKKKVTPEIEAGIKTVLRDLGLSNPVVQFVDLNYDDYKAANNNEKDIDRWLLTNYHYVLASHGFNVFGNWGQVLRASEIRQQFFLHTAELRAALVRASHTRKYLNFLGESLPRLLQERVG